MCRYPIKAYVDVIIESYPVEFKSSLASCLQTGMSIAITLDSRQLNSLQFFGQNVSKMISAGDQDACFTWAGFGITCALSSEMTLNSLLAVSMLVMDRRICVLSEHPSNPYIQKALILCNQAMACEDSYPHPEELILTSGLIFAFSLLFPNFLPLVADGPGKLDILFLARANILIYERYFDILQTSDVKTLMEPLSKRIQIHRNGQIEFVNFLYESLQSAKEWGEIGQEEETLCGTTLDTIQALCSNAMICNNSYPILRILNTLDPKFSDCCRCRNPFSTCVFTYIATILRMTLFMSDFMSAWDDYILSSYDIVPKHMHYILNRAIGLYEGNDFFNDYAWLSKLRAK